jgi:hypothetical protein
MQRGDMERAIELRQAVAELERSMQAFLDEKIAQGVPLDHAVRVLEETILQVHALQLHALEVHKRRAALKSV